MYLIKQSYEILDYPSSLRLLEAAGRVCYKSEARITRTSARPFIEGIIRSGHESVIEHEKVTVRLITNRGTSHQVVRHRLASYSQESQRYCDYEKLGIVFIIPVQCKHLLEGGADSMNNLYLCNHPAEHEWYLAMLLAEKKYYNLRAEGWAPEEARDVLPNATKTELVLTANLREWRHIFRERALNKRAQAQVRDLMISVMLDLNGKLPGIFNDLVAEYILS